VDQATHNKIVSFIWGIADDVLRDLFKRGKYPDVILPMCVIRRMDAVLEPTKQAVLDTKKMLDEAGITEQRAALCAATDGQAFYNTSRFTLRDLKSRGSNCWPTSRTTWTTFRPTSRTFSTTSSSATNSRPSPRPTPSAPSSTSSSTLT
jgi:type I restriction-modification system DNA methylase subunit